jgi:hypothetical protein
MPVFTGKGSRLKIAQDIGLRRSYILGEPLAVPVVAPHQATLDYLANGDKTAAVLYTQDGVPVNPSAWEFVDTGVGVVEYGAILISLEVFDRNATYYFDYQSTSRDVLDQLSFTDLRQMIRVGDFPSQVKYLEYLDYFVPTSVTAPTPATTNPHNTPIVMTPPQAIDSLTTASVRVNNTVIGTALNITLDVGASAVADFYKGWYVVMASGAIAGQGRLITAYDGVTKIATIDPLGPAWPAPFPALGDIFALTPGPAVADPATFAGQGILAMNPATAYNGLYTREYRLTVSGSGGAAPNRWVSFNWEAMPYSGGNTSDFPVPKHSLIAPPSTGAINEGPGALNILLEKELRVDVLWPDPAAGNFAMGDEFVFVAEGAALFELDPRLVQTNQFPVVHAPVADAGNTGTGVISLNLDNGFDSSFNTKWHAEVVAAAGGMGVRTATIAVTKMNTESGTDPATRIIEYSIALNEAVPTQQVHCAIGDNVYLDFVFGAVHFVVGDKWTITADAARSFFTAKDPRTYSLKVTAAPIGSVAIFWWTDTYEGGFGTLTFTAAGNVVPAGDFPDGLRLYARNIETYNRHVVDDIHTFAATVVTSTTGTALMDWSLRQRTDEAIDTADVLHDALGTITGTPDTWYIILQNLPDAVTWVKDQSGPAGADAFISYTEITGTPYIWFTTQPTGIVTVRYEYKGDEPGPSQVYYLTAHYLRPAVDYDIPLRHLTVDDANDNLGPISVDNDLQIMAQIAFENNVFAIWTCQAQDRDNDGYLTDYDYKQAVLATEVKSDITDVIVLNRYGVMAYAKDSVIRMNDPFERKERLLWQGFPVGTLVGDIDTPNTLYYNARRSLQVYGDNPAHGAIIGIANTWGKRTILFDDGSTTQVTLDGSFIAGALASKNDSFNDPTATILRQELLGFDTMQEFSDKEQILLGTAGLVYITPQGGDGAAPYLIEESITVDTTAPDTKEISAMVQKQFVTRNLRDAVDKALIAIVPASKMAAVILTQSFIVETLAGYVTQGYIAPYADDAGNERPVDPNEDVEVFADKNDPTLYHVKYWYILRYPLKRIFALYSVDVKAFG